ncbi:hypothetical protein G7046_g3223 [Stylonectria norvegica]|nr:hypothetical protein G7046_g3223 [Stylonectria norvegica]
MSDNYSYKSSGTNSQVSILYSFTHDTFHADLVQGNHYCARDYGSDASNSNSYHYSNSDGSYYYSNPSGSTYHNDGQGGSTYTPPSDNSSSSSSGGGSKSK